SRFTKKDKRSDRKQVEELIDVARVSVFFIDDMQTVRPGEEGSSGLIRKTADAADIPVKEFELDVQFRCKGSEGFVNWVDNTLGIRRTAEVLWNRENEFDFRVVGSVEELDSMIREKHALGNSARLAAGFCWPWSKERDGDRLVEDVRIGSWARPWNARPEMTKLPAGIPKSNFWATDPAGIDQVGCVYTAQGFEFDYVGILFGRDLRYDPKRGGWVGDRSASADPLVKRAKDEEFLALARNTYRVLMTRGLKGCYVAFLDKDTEAFVRSRIESRPGDGAPLTVKPEREDESEAVPPHLRKLTRRGLELWELFAPCTTGASALSVEVLISTVNDVAWLLEREDMVGWEEDEERKEALRASLLRAMSDLAAANREALVERVLGGDER
ncbi:MAG: DUF2075 domain-containing protein, partial [Gemmatimonadota bacterium]|nr:DUF2075 domain-containing protein [Gemmatimonadota bacterium]